VFQFLFLVQETEILDTKVLKHSRVSKYISFPCSRDEPEFSSLVLPFLPSKRDVRTSGNLLPLFSSFFPRRGTYGRAGNFVSKLFFSSSPWPHMPTEPKTEGLWANKVKDIQQRKRKFQLRRVLNIYGALSLFFYFVDLA
jgi:hypothetical protein